MKKIVCAFSLTLIATVAHASDGLIEINQVAALAGGVSANPAAGCVDDPGFPVTLCNPGSFILTGNLVVAGDTNAIDLLTDDVSIDLNGFSISGPSACTPSSCPSGSSGGIIRQFIPPSSNGGHRSRVFNGTIRGFGANCVFLEEHAHVTNLLVFECGARGINVLGHSIVQDNRVFSVGLEGIRMQGEGSVFANNTVTDASLRSGEDRAAIQGGTATAGNFCADQSCSSKAERRYYLSDTSVPGNAVVGSCDTGFHVASLPELINTTSLWYDEVRGAQVAAYDDRSAGPPTSLIGWARTGYFSVEVALPGRANCLIWSSADASKFGTVIFWNNQTDSADNFAPWRLEVQSCDEFERVWCIED